ncbi:MAG: TIR domain-containing protein [Roseburia sp.]|nr:TIR domain-containing protein [Roseburia sp.]
MAHKTFISYKYRDVVENKENDNLRDRIIKKLGDDAKYYLGENSSSPYLGDLKTETIKRKLSDMIYGTSVMIVILSPNIKQTNRYDIVDILEENNISYYPELMDN